MFHSYDDHRMATAGAVIGLAVPGVEVENIATTAKTLPEFARMWARMLDAADALITTEGEFDEERRPRSGRTGKVPAADARRPAHEDAVEGFVTAVDRGRYTLPDPRRRTDERRPWSR